MNMPKMIEYDGRKIAKRPSQYDQEVLEEVFDYLKPSLKDYLQRWDESDVESLRKHFLLISSTDGYDIASHMDMYARLGGSRELVDIFDNAPFRKVLSKHIQAWIDYFKIEPLFKIGDRVRWFGLGGKIVRTSDSYMPGYYAVAAPGTKDNVYHLIPWEECELVESE